MNIERSGMFPRREIIVFMKFVVVCFYLVVHLANFKVLGRCLYRDVLGLVDV